MHKGSTQLIWKQKQHSEFHIKKRRATSGILKTEFTFSISQKEKPINIEKNKITFSISEKESIDNTTYVQNKNHILNLA